MAKVLVVDDRPLNRELLRTLLQYQQHEVYEAGEGREALGVARAQTPDLIITDILMPTMDGYEFVRQLRADPQLAETQVIFYTASYKTKEAKEKARTCQVEHLLFKPCEPEDILAVVAKALSGTSSAEPLPALSDTRVSELASTSIRLTAVTELCLDLSAEREPTVLLDKFCHSARELVKAQSALLLLRQDHPVCFVSGSQQLPPGDPQGWILGMPDRFAGHEALHSNQPGPEFTGLPLPEDLGPLHNLLGVRLHSHQETYGWLCCFNKTSGFDEQDQHLLLTLAAQVGQTYENALMFARLEQQTLALQRQNRELEAADELLRNLTRQVPGMLYQHRVYPDARTQMTFISDGVRRIFGLEPRQAQANPALLREHVHPQDQPALDAYVSEAIANPGLSRISYRVCVPGEADKWVHSEVMTERLDDGSVLWHGYLVDITAQRQLEESLIGSEERMRLAQASIGMGVWEYDFTQGQLVLDAQMCRLLGIRPEAAAAARDLEQWVHPDDQEYLRAARQRLLQDPNPTGPAYVDYRIIRPDGEVRHIENYWQVFAGGKRLIGSARDVTERYQTQLALERSEERLRIAQNAVGMGVWELDLLTGEANFDDQLCHLMGMEAGRDNQNTAAMVACLHPEDRIAAESTIERALRGENETTYSNFRVIHPNGEIHYLEGQARVFAAPDGSFRRLIGSTRDVTERKLAEAEIEASHDQLEIMILELRRLAIRAEAANLAKGEFLNNMNHELRTPLNGVLGGVELLKHSFLTQEQQGFADLIQRSGKSLLDLIDDVLNFTSIEDHLLEPAPFSLSELIAGASTRLQAELQRKNLSFESRVEAGLPDQQLGDAVRLGQALHHLLENAVKFTPAGQIRLSVSSPGRSAESLQMRFEVHDTGIGIAPEQLGHIFTPFAQADSSLTRRFGGTGIGLSLASQLVGLMGGQIECQSELGQGSCFGFTITLALPALTPERAQPATPQASLPAAAGSGPRVLLVEDNPINQAVTEAILKKLGYAVEIAGDGSEALRSLQSAHFELVLMDCQMPVMDGYEATGRIRAGEGGPDPSIPIIAVTAHVSALDRERCLAAGMDDYLPKPFSPTELSEMLQRWLLARKSASQNLAI